MKKLTITIALTTLLSLSVFAHPVDVKTAQKVATTFLNNNGAKAAQLTDLSKAAGFQNLYIFTAEQGFVVMAADDCVQPILGYSLDGFILDEDMPDNVRGWLQGYDDEIQFAIDNQMRATAETAKQWKDLTEGNTKAGKATTVVPALLQTQWNQNGGYYSGTYVTLFNNLCPLKGNTRTVTGCVATAMAQIMKYWNQPAHGIGSHSYTWNNQTLSADFANTNYDWAHMTNTYGKNSTETEKLAVATLMYHCGVSVNMNYNTAESGGSSASTDAVAEALKTYFNYSPDIEYRSKDIYTNDVWTKMVKDELDAGRPLQYRGSTGSGGGHSFVCDGYDSNNKFHFNWGWAGSYDGYFSLDNLNTGANTQTGAGNGDYTNDQAAIFGIQPVQCAASEPTNLTYTLNGLQNITLSWTAANGAASYNIYRNNNCIGNSTTTSYTENAPFGGNNYYVRSVDNNGNLSLSSNPVSVFVDYQQPVVNDLGAMLEGNNVSLSWTAPDWCYPETESAVLNYGQGSVYYIWDYTYYGHRYPASTLSQYAGKAVYKASTYIRYTGTYSIYIYTKSTQNDKPDPNSLAFSKTGVDISVSNVWYDFNTDDPILLTGTDDLWVVIKQENTGQKNPVPSFNLSTHNTNAFYAGFNSPTDLYDAYSSLNCSWFINTYLTDGTYTYNLYQDGTPIAQNLTETTYDASLNDDAANLFTVKTKFYGGETAASNAIGFAKGTASVANLEMAANDQMTVTVNSKLTVNGTMSNSNAANLVLEDGAQLVHNSEGVKATVKKTIAPYTVQQNQGNDETNGWHFIASPVIESIEPSEDNGLLSGNYDLYLYEEHTHMWRNHKEHIVDGTNQNAASGFLLNYKQGYLYANSTSNTLQFAGTLTPSDNTVSISNLSYSSSTLTGFNLVGNPYTHNVTSYAGYNVVDNCYRMNEDGSDVFPSTIDQANPLLPAEGFFVKATSDDASITFNSNSRSETTQSASIQLDLVSDNLTLDRLIVKREGEPLEKLSLRENGTKIFATKDNQKIAVAIAEGNEQAVNFKAEKNGIFTLRVKIEPKEWMYLHLIDNMTGTHINLLTTPNYTFEAKTGDYESRFKLLFAAAKEETETFDNESFGFIINGQFQSIIGQGLLQVIDLNGRILRSANETDCIGLDGLTAGVYVIRFITANSVRTQKIVVE